MNLATRRAFPNIVESGWHRSDIVTRVGIDPGKMCIRSVYSCPNCCLAFAIPQKSVTDSVWWTTLVCTNLSAIKQPLKEWKCNNMHCLRRTESGYRLCLDMHENCYFCVRYGFNSYECYNQYIYVPCRQCYDKYWITTYNNEPYGFPMHFREWN